GTAHRALRSRSFSLSRSSSVRWRRWPTTGTGRSTSIRGPHDGFPTELARPCWSCCYNAHIQRPTPKTVQVHESEAPVSKGAGKSRLRRSDDRRHDSYEFVAITYLSRQTEP